MHLLKTATVAVCSALLSQAAYVAPWQQLPATPQLPSSTFGATANVNGIKLWYATFGAGGALSSNPPIIVLHPGLGSSRWMANQINYLKTLPYTTIAIDARGQGRSTDDPSKPITYDLMAQDVLALLNQLHISKAIFVGWSDGGNVALNIAMTNPSKVDRIFAYGANYIPENFNASAAETAPTVPLAYARFEAEYKQINPYPKNWDQIFARVGDMQAKLPQWGGAAFATIPTPYNSNNYPLIWIVDGDKEEIVNRDVPTQISDWVRLVSPNR